MPFEFYQHASEIILIVLISRTYQCFRNYEPIFAKTLCGDVILVLQINNRY